MSSLTVAVTSPGVGGRSRDIPGWWGTGVSHREHLETGT